MPAAPRSAGTQRLPGGCPSSPRAPRAGAAREARGGAAALGALRGGGTANLAGRPQSPRRPRRPPAPTGAEARGARGGGRSRCHARRAPGNQWAGRENAGCTRGPRVPTARAVNHRQSLAPPGHGAGPARSAAPSRCLRCDPCLGRHRRWGAFCARRGLVPGLGCRAVAAALEGLPWGSAASPLGPALSGCPRCGLCSRRPPPVRGERRGRRGRRLPPLSGVAARGVALGNTLL